MFGHTYFSEDVLRVTRTAIVECNLDANDWELYTASKDCTEAAAQLNQTLQKAVNESGNWNSVYEAVFAKMGELREFGARDSEPLQVLRSILNHIYGQDY